MNPSKLINDFFTEMGWFSQYVMLSMGFLCFLGVVLIFFQPEGSLELAKSIISFAGVYVVCSVIIMGVIYCLNPDDDNEKPSGNKNDREIELIKFDIHQHCHKSCTAEHCNNCALRRYKEAGI